MSLPSRLPLSQLLVTGLLLLTSAGCAYRSGQTALDRYVQAPDPAYAYRHLANVEGKGFRSHVLEMTSQSWLTTNEVNRTLWKHWLLITVPEGARPGTALLFIGGGGNESAPPRGADEKLVRVAIRTPGTLASTPDFDSENPPSRLPATRRASARGRAISEARRISCVSSGAAPPSGGIPSRLLPLASVVLPWGKVPVPQLTKRWLNAWAPEAGREVLVWDDRLPGFGIRAYPSGRRA